MDPQKVKDRIVADRDALDRLALKIPGFKGYIAYTENYNADRLVRTAFAARLRDIRTRLRSSMEDLTRSGGLMILPALESVDVKIESIIQTVSAAEFGADASFSHSKTSLTDTDHDTLLAKDASIIDRCDPLAALVEQIISATDDKKEEAAKAVRDELEKIRLLWNERTSLLGGV